MIVRRGMTLIEIMVVIAIMVALIGLLFPVGVQAIRLARATGTAQRISGVLTGLSAHAAASDGVAVFLQREVGLGGALKLDYPAGHLVPVDGTWLDYSQACNLRFPYGQGGLRFQPGARAASETPPANFSLSQLNAGKSLELLVAAGIIPPGPSAEVVYADNRSSDVPWNDRWGNPLTVAYALYQYGPALGPGEAIPPSADFDNQWRGALQRYGSTRSLLIAVGAGGPVLPASLSGQITTRFVGAARDAALADLWQHIDQVANRGPDGNPLWRVEVGASPSVNAAARAPWSGVRRAEASDHRYCLMSAPEELR